MILAGKDYKKTGFGRRIRAPYFSYVLGGGGRPLLDPKSGNSRRGGISGGWGCEAFGGEGGGAPKDPSG